MQIDMRGVRKTGSVHAVRCIDLRIAAGGSSPARPNGAGKTTTWTSAPVVTDHGPVGGVRDAAAPGVSRGLVSAVLQTGGLLRT
jgi:hypothetical protein